VPDNDLLPAAAQLARNIVARLLLAALQMDSFPLFKSVERMLGNQRDVLQHLTSTQVASMLLAALQQDNQDHMDCVRGLCRRPAAAGLNSTAVGRMLWAALQLRLWGFTRAVAELCKLPAAAHISHKEMVRLLDELCSLHSTGAVNKDAVGSLHKAQRVRYQSSSSVAELLAAAAECGAGGAMDELCKLRAVKALSSAAVLPAMGTEALCKLPAAQQ
jgi:hypothetical protein